jgi:hypothetical protein
VSAITTTRRKPKPFAWSYSKIKNFKSCPKRYWHVDVQRDIKEEESEQLKQGNLLHDAAAKRIDAGKPLPGTTVYRTALEEWCVKILAGHADTKAFEAAAPGAKMLVEQKLAITAEFGPTTWFGTDDAPAWYRGIGDVIKIVGPVALIIDWKTGKIVEDSQQLALMAACVFAHHPQVQRVRSQFIWLKEDAESRADYSRADMPAMWAGILPEVTTLKTAHETLNFPAKPGSLCKRWCPVHVCPHHGE